MRMVTLDHKKKIGQRVIKQSQQRYLKTQEVVLPPTLNIYKWEKNGDSEKMPTYRFYNRKTGLVYEEYMMMSEMEKLVKKKHLELLPPTQMNIVSSVGSVDSKTDSGFNEV